MSRKEIRQMLEEWGEPKVRQMLADGHPFFGDVDSSYHKEVLLWLEEKDEASLAARSDEVISIASDANTIARDANTIALAAASLDSEANAIARRDRKYPLIETIISIAIAIKTAIWK